MRFSDFYLCFLAFRKISDERVADFLIMEKSDEKIRNQFWESMS
jgi:hypothetical protein